MVVKIEKFSPLAVNRVRRVNRQKILLLRFDNFEEGAKLTSTGCISYYAATLTLYVRVSASFAFHENSFQIKRLNGNSLTFFFYFKQRVSHFKRMKKLSRGKDPYRRVLLLTQRS